MKEKQQSTANGPLSTVEQRKLVKEHITQTIDLGQTWYIIDYKWFEAWKDYVNYCSAASNSKGDCPGPIDNGELISDTGSLKDQMMEGSHFELVPDKIWDMLVSCYGVVDGQEPLARNVIEVGTFSKTKRVEIYPLELLLAHYKKPTDGQVVRCSQGMTVESLTEKMRGLFDVEKESEVKLMGSYMSDKYEELSTPSNTLSQANLQPRQFVVLVEKVNGKWPSVDHYKTTSAANFSSPSNARSSTSSATAMTPFKSPSSDRRTYGSSNGYASGGYSAASSSSSHNHDKMFSSSPNAGLCGLNNLGNTCFMNSALQCLSNVPQLTEYFTSDKWCNDLNEDNPLGMKGQIADTYAHLMKNMWSGRNSSTAPRSFKGAVGRFAPRFSGYQQQDSHELMAFLLDGLHEDLNRIKKKPYIEIKAANGRPDEEVAAEAWSDYRKRNDSIIIDLFHGQLKSTLECPECTNTSVTFDPFCYLSLPIPGIPDKHLVVHYVPADPLRQPVKCRVSVPQDGCISDLCDVIANMFSTSRKRLMCAELHRNRFHKIYDGGYSLRSLRENDQLFVYEIDPSEGRSVIAVYLKKSGKNYTSSANQQNISWPMLMSVPAEITYDQLYDVIRHQCQRLVDCKQEKVYLSGGHNEDLHREKVDTGREKADEEVVNGDELMETSDEQEGQLLSITQDDLNMSDNDADNHGQSGDQQEIITLKDETLSLPRNLFQIEHVSIYGNRESNLSRDKPLIFKSNTYTYLSVVFDEEVTDTVLYIDEAFDVDKHSSLQEQLSERPTVTLKDCLQLFTSREKLGKHDTWYCPTCKSHVEASKEFGLWMLPKYLVIQLKRYKSSHSVYSYSSRDKVDTYVYYPVQDLDVSEWMVQQPSENCLYDLIAVSNHYGGLGGGHYTAYGKNHHLNKWYYFDDSSVSSATPDSVVSKSGYLLIYERKQ